MIQMGTMLRVLDNSGGILCKCIKVYKKRIGVIGDKILVTVRKIKYKKNLFHSMSSRIIVENNTMYKAIILYTTKGFVRRDGRHIKFNKNGVVLLTRLQEKLIGTRIYGSTVKEFRNKKYLKVLVLGSKLM